VDQRRLEIIIEARNEAKAAFDKAGFNAKRLKDDLKALGIEAGTLKLKLARIEPGTHVWDVFSKQLSQVEQKMHALSAASEVAQEKFKKFNTGVRNFGIGMSVGVTAPLMLLGRQAWGMFEGLQNLQQGLRATVGSESEFQAQWKEIEKLTEKGIPGLTDEAITQTLSQLENAKMSATDAMTAIEGFGSALAKVGKGERLQMVVQGIQAALNRPQLDQSAIGRIPRLVPQMQPAMQAIWGTTDINKIAGGGVTSMEFFRKISQYLKDLPPMGQTATGTMQKLEEGFQQMAMVVGEQLLPQMDNLTQRVQGAADWFKQLSPAMKSTIVRSLELLAALGPMALMVASLTTVWGALKLVWTALPFILGRVTGALVLAVTTPLGAVLTLVAAVGALALAWYNVTIGAEKAAEADWQAAKGNAAAQGRPVLQDIQRAQLGKRTAYGDLADMTDEQVYAQLTDAEKKAAWDQYRADVRKFKHPTPAANLGADKPVAKESKSNAAWEAAVRSERDAKAAWQLIAATKGLEGFALQEKTAEAELHKTLAELERQKKQHLPVLERIKLAYAEYQKKLREIKDAKAKQAAEWASQGLEAAQELLYLRLGTNKGVTPADKMELDARQAYEKQMRDLDKLAAEGQPVGNQRALAKAQYDMARDEARKAREAAKVEAKQAQDDAIRAANDKAQAVADAQLALADSVMGGIKSKGGGLLEQIAQIVKLQGADEHRLVILKHRLADTKDETEQLQIQAEINNTLARIQDRKNSTLQSTIDAAKSRAGMASGWADYLKEFGSTSDANTATEAAIQAQLDVAAAIQYAMSVTPKASEKYVELGMSLLDVAKNAATLKKGLDDAAMTRGDASLGALRAYKAMQEAGGYDTRQTQAQIIRMERDKLQLLQQQLAVAEQLGQQAGADNIRKSIFELRKEIMATQQTQVRWMSITDLWRMGMETAARSRVRLSPAFATGSPGQQPTVQSDPALTAAIRALAEAIKNMTGDYLG